MEMKNEANQGQWTGCKYRKKANQEYVS